MMSQITTTSHDFGFIAKHISMGITFSNTYKVELKAVLIALFIFLQIVIMIRVMLFASKRQDQRIQSWQRLSNSLGQVHFFIFWLPATVVAVSMLREYEKESQSGLLAAVSIGLIFNLGLLILNLVYRDLSVSDNKLVSNSTYFYCFRALQGILAAVLVVLSRDSDSNSLINLKLGGILILECVSCGVLFFTQPFLNFKMTLLANLSQTISLMAVINVILNAVIYGSTILFSSNIFFGTLLFAPLALRFVKWLIQKKISDIQMLEESNITAKPNVWTIHRVLYLRKLLKSGIFTQNLGKYKLVELSQAAFVKSFVESRSENSDQITAEERKNIFANKLRSICKISSDPFLKFMLAEFLFEVLEFTMEPAILLNEILEQKKVKFSLKKSIHHLQNKINRSIIDRLEMKKTKDLDVHNFLKCNKINEKFRSMLTADITYSKIFYKTFTDSHPIAKNFIDNISLKKKNFQQIERFWEQTGQACSREFKIMILEYGIYLSVVYLDRESGRKHIKNFIKSINESMNNWEADKICNKTLTDPKNVFVVIGGEKRNIGTVLSVSGDTEYVFGYQKDLIMGKNIEMLMPNFLVGNHNNYILNRFKSSQFQIAHYVGDIFARDKKGFLRKINATTTLLADCKDGIKIWGAVRLNRELNSYLLANEDGVIDGISQDLAEELGLKGTDLIPLSKLKPNLDTIVKLIAKEDYKSKVNIFDNKTYNTQGTQHSLTNIKEDDLEEVQKFIDSGLVISIDTRFDASSSNLKTSEKKYLCIFNLLTLVGKKKVIIKFQKIDETIVRQNIFPEKSRSLMNKSEYSITPSQIPAEFRAESNEVSVVIDHHFTIPSNKLLFVQRVGNSRNYEGNERPEDSSTSSKVTYKQDSFKVESHYDNKAKINYSTSSQESKKNQISRQRYTESLSMLKFYRGRDMKLRFVVLCIPFLMVLISMIILLLNSTHGIERVKTLLTFFSGIQTIDINVSSMSKSNFLIYILRLLHVYSDFIVVTLGEMETYYNTIMLTQRQITENMVNLDFQTQSLFYDKDQKIFHGAYDLTTPNAYNYGDFFGIAEDNVMKATYIRKLLIPDVFVSTPVQVNYQNSLYSNLNNDILIKADQIKDDLVFDIKDSLESMADQSYNQIYITSAVFAVCFLIFAIQARQGNNENIEFLNNTLNGKFTEDCNTQLNNLTNLQAAIDSQDYHQMLKLENRRINSKMMSKEKVKAGQIINTTRKTFNFFRLQTFFLTVASGALILMVINFAILIVAENTFLDQVNNLPEKTDDIYYASFYLKQTQIVLISYYAYTWRRDSYVLNTPAQECFFNYIEKFHKEMQKISSRFSLGFQEKLNENICGYVPVNSPFNNCPNAMNGVGARGIQPFFNEFIVNIETMKASLSSYPFLSPQYIGTALSDYATSLFEVSYYYITPALTSFIEDGATEILDLLDEGRKPVAVYIAIGICLTIVFLAYMIMVIYPKLILTRQSMCEVLVMFPLKSILASRGLMELLIADSKEFYGVLKKGAQNEDDIGHEN